MALVFVIAIIILVKNNARKKTIAIAIIIFVILNLAISVLYSNNLKRFNSVEEVYYHLNRVTSVEGTYNPSMRFDTFEEAYHYSYPYDNIKEKYVYGNHAIVTGTHRKGSTYKTYEKDDKGWKIISDSATFGRNKTILFGTKYLGSVMWIPSEEINFLTVYSVTSVDIITIEDNIGSDFQLNDAGDRYYIFNKSFPENYTLFINGQAMPVDFKTSTNEIITFWLSALIPIAGVLIFIVYLIRKRKNKLKN